MDDINSTLSRLLQPGQADDSDTTGEIRHGFSLGTHNLLLQAGTYCELAARQNICAIPDCPNWFAGFINHRGHAVPVYDLSRYLELDSGRTRADKAFWLLLLNPHPDTAGLIIHALPAVLSDVSVNTRSRTFEIPSALAPFTGQAWVQNGELWHELDHGALLNHLKTQFQLPKQQ